MHKHLLNGRVVRDGVVQQDGPGIARNQKAFLVEKLKNTRKIKSAIFFLRPFDHIALGHPTYFDIIKQPMDLSTAANKLNSDQYGSPQSFMDDIQLIANNATKSFGPQHAVSTDGDSMLAYVRYFMSKLPSPDPTSTKTTAKAPQDTTGTCTIAIGLPSHRALVLWSRWLYGRPMWTQEDCANVNDDLLALASIYKLCAGTVLFNDVCKDLDALNACSDAIRQILFDEVHPLNNPLKVLCVQLDRPDSGIFTMLVNWLVYGECGSNGKTKDWLHSVEGKHPDFFKALSNEFAKKVMGEAPPDMMARCAYHVHPAWSQCDKAA